MSNLEKKIKNYLSALFPFFLILFFWPKIFNYNVQIFKFAVALLLGGVYLSFRISQKGEMHIPRWWWLIVSLYGYFVLSLVISDNKDAGIARLVLLFIYGLLYLLSNDALQSVLNKNVLLKALIVAVGLMMTLAIVDVISAYRDWWTVFGFLGESPPFTYRIGYVMHANHWLGLANLFLPVVGVLLFTSEDKITRWLAGIWVLLYILIAYFSSSRGGYVAIAAGGGFL